MGFTLPREQYEAVANAEPGAVERVLKLVRARMARFQEAAAGGRGPRQPGCAPAVSSSQPGSPAFAAAHGGAATAGEAMPYAPAVAAAADSIAALRLGGPGDAPGKLAAAWTAGGRPAGSPAFPTLDQALASSLAEKEQQLEELRDVNEVWPLAWVGAQGTARWLRVCCKQTCPQGLRGCCCTLQSSAQRHHCA